MAFAHITDISDPMIQLVFMLFKRQKLHNKLSQFNKLHKHKGTHLYLNELEIIFFLIEFFCHFVDHHAVISRGNEWETIKVG